MTDLGQSNNLTFTTEPKTRRHLTRGPFISGARAAEFMQHLWDRKLRKSCRYNTLKWEWENYCQSNEKRTTEKYLGAPEETVRSHGASVVRINRTSGKVAHFQYSNDRRVQKKTGLLEILGYVTLKPEEIPIEQGNVKLLKKTGNWIAILHHERMDYYTEQTTLEPANSIPESNEESEVIKDDLRVCSLLDGEELSPREGVGGETVLEVSPKVEATERTLGREIKKEEEVIDSTHTNQSSESEAYPNTTGMQRELTPEASQLLKASREASG